MKPWLMNSMAKKRGTEARRNDKRIGAKYWMRIHEIIKPVGTHKSQPPLSPEASRERAIDRQQQRVKVQKKAQQVQKARARLNHLSAQQSHLAGSAQ